MLQRTIGNQALGRAVRSNQENAAPFSEAGALRNSAGINSIVARGSNLQIARKPDFTTPAVTVTPNLAGRVQRFVMSDAEWKSKSSRVGKQRSLKLLDIDEALQKYNASQHEPLEVRMQLLRELRSATFKWENNKKTDSHGMAVSSRLEIVQKLRHRVHEELSTLSGENVKAKSSTNPQHVVDSSNELYKRAAREMRETLSLSEKKRKALQGANDFGHWSALMTEVTNLRQRSDALGMIAVQGGPAAVADQTNAVQSAQGVEAAINALRIIAMRYATGVKTGNYDLPSLQARRTTVGNSFQAMDAQGSQFFAISQQLGTIIQNITDFAGLAGIDLTGAVDDKGGARDLEDEDPDGFEPVKEVLGFLDQGGTLATFYGGTDNSGFIESHHAKPEGDDTRTGSQKAVGDFFGQMDPGDKAGQDYMWGGGDVVGGIVGTFSGGIEIYNAIKTLRDPKADSDKKRQAKEALAQAGVGTVGSFIRFVAGALTIHRGGQQYDSDDDGVLTTVGKLSGSGFGFSKEGGSDVSTDMRMAGDFAGILTGVVSFINQLVEAVAWLRGDAKEEWQGGGVRQKVEVIGTGLSKLAGVINTGAGSGFNTAKMVMQIQGGGAVTSTAENMTKVGLAGGAGAGAMPIIGLVVSAMNTIQNGYKMVRLAIRKYDIKKKLKDIYADRKNTDLDTAEAIEMVDLTLFKRMVRVGIELGHNLAQLAGGAATVSGMGSAVGMSISLSSTLAKIGQVGLRVGKQKARNRKAKKRAKKDEKRNRSFEAYSDWKRRKQREAGDDKWKRFWAGVDIKFTPNWDKSSSEKGMERREAALKIVEMNDMTVYHGLGIHKHHLAGKEIGEKLQLVVEALNKRD